MASNIWHYTLPASHILSSDSMRFYQEMQELDREAEAASEGAGDDKSSDKAKAQQFHAFVANLRNTSLPVVMYQDRFNDKNLKNAISCGGTNVGV
eukprot:scaffold87655_cov47-Prasinocladus_malaysianus.AAC.1